MKKIALALAATLASTPAMAGPYVNVEANSSYTGSDFTSRTTDAHVGWEGDVGQLGYYIQGGPAFINGDAVDGETQLSGKLGGSVNATDKLGVYGELSFLTAEGDADNSYGSKLGVKYSF